MAFRSSAKPLVGAAIFTDDRQVFLGSNRGNELLRRLALHFKTIEKGAIGNGRENRVRYKYPNVSKKSSKLKLP